jgi:hypothetical protein
LQEKLRERTKLEALRSQADARRIEAEGKAVAAKAFADDCAGRRDSREKQAAKLKQEGEARRTSFAGAKSQFDKDAIAVQQARKDQEVLRYWIDGLRDKLTGFEKSVATITQLGETVKTWNPGLLKAAADKEQSAGTHLEEVSRQLIAITEVHHALKEQLKEIASGLCPFLKESCRQFDPVKVSVDAQAKEADVACLTKQETAARDAFQQAKAEANRLHAVESKIATTRETLAARIEELRHETGRVLTSDIVESCRRLSAFTAHNPVELSASSPPTTETSGTWLKQTRDLYVSAHAWFQAISPLLNERFDSFDQSSRAARSRRARTEVAGERARRSTAGNRCPDQDTRPTNSRKAQELRATG